MFGLPVPGEEIQSWTDCNVTRTPLIRPAATFSRGEKGAPLSLRLGNGSMDTPGSARNNAADWNSLSLRTNFWARNEMLDTSA